MVDPEWMTFYQVVAQDIVSAKKQQWTTAYYVLLALAAIIVFYDMVKLKLGGILIFKLLILFSSIIIVIGGLISIFALQISLTNNRTKLMGIRDKFSPDLQEIWKVPPKYTSLFHYFEIVLIFYCAFIIGLAFVALILEI